MKILVAFTLCALFGWEVAGKEVCQKCPITENANNLLKFIFYGIRKDYTETSFALAVGPILNALAQLSLYSKGDTFEDISDVLGTKDSKLVTSLLKCANNAIVQSSIMLRYDTKLYADDEYEFCPKFKKTYSENFNGIAENLDFDDPKEAAKKINEWLDRKEVDQAGNKDLVYTNITQKGTGLLLVSTIEIELDYQTKYFNIKAVKKADFYSINEKKRTMSALYGEAVVQYANIKKYDAEVIGIPVKGNFTVIVIQPNENDGLPGLLNKLKNVNIFDEILPILQSKCVELTLPLRKVATQSDVTETLKKYRNLDIIFSKERAEFAGITKNGKPGLVDDFVGELYIADQVPKDIVTKKNIGDCPDGKLIKVEINRPHIFFLLADVVGVKPTAALVNGVYY